ncbi:prepilin peptidase [Francisella orientalis]|uniref:Prepilin leader peptidase/N-methyltransferase n=1 Tax=Francisella orientalis TaxID=299583 RepID=A0AAP6X822_9GAMM|nr:A24 family peptidase [Francisella orientalis]AFJ43778.1 type IV pilus prepilin peptidase PilD [Francisella orientalis str. Toba 04]AHB98325.1 peptidase A24 [Francisella orientalis LADL 07-285A]AKN85477.1 Type 4 prepilin-like proteins leader peptide-processing enzyme [Francisella orientalis FNO12]AKN87016.1 Type 4 prepilin-like proteins leader peptide-processing enzyme [Francisella orientalis FNO24]AKN88554.1 Type 4 prepilin-like proteins leader peptide-processing enzyme [Francisella orienta
MYYDIYIIFLFIFLFGAAVGSFLNVIIYRVPNKIFADEKIISREILELPKQESSQNFSLTAPSRCPKCKNKLKYRHNIPILGWFILKDKCYFCKESISFEYPLIEFITAVVFITIFYIFRFTIQAVAMAGLSTFFIPLFFIDAKYQILPDSLTLPLVWIGIILNYYNVFSTLDQSVWGAIIGYLSLWSVFWIYKILTGKEGLGYGDFKLLAAIGAWFGYTVLLYTIFASCIFGILIAIGINLIAKRTNVIPFGPAIILATFFYLLTKDNLYIWYNHVMFIQY